MKAPLKFPQLAAWSLFRDARVRPGVFPVTRVLLVMLMAVESAGLVLAMSGLAAGEYLGLSVASLESFELWRLLTFGFSCFVPSGADTAAMVSSLVSSILLFVFSFSAILCSVGSIENRLGSRGALGVVIAVVTAQAFFGLVALGQEWCFSPTGIVFALMVFSFISDIESRRRVDERIQDIRIAVFAFCLLICGVVSAFSPEFQPVLAGLAAGPLIAVGAIAARRRAEEAMLDLQGSGEVGGHYFAADADLLTLPELRRKADRLLEKVGRDGVEALSYQEKRFLKQASQRLRHVDDESGQNR